LEEIWVGHGYFLVKRQGNPLFSTKWPVFWAFHPVPGEPAGLIFGRLPGSNYVLASFQRLAEKPVACKKRGRNKETLIFPCCFLRSRS
jgi:hypothetical protein